MFIVVLVALTSAIVWLAVRRRAGFAGRRLRPALARVAELVGLTVLLFVLNLATGFVLVLLLRRATGRFVSLYVNTDVTLLVLSALQAVALQWWKGEGRD